jgi:tRNA G18 (ribose-2'-O)-methylase SpoU
LLELTEKNYQNTIDKYKEWSIQEIQRDLYLNNNNFIACMDHIHNDFNIGQILRSANAFGAKEMFYIGKKQWDRRGAVGTHNYTYFNHFESVDLFMNKVRESYFSTDSLPIKTIAVEQISGSENIYDFDFSQLDGYTPCFIFGNESNGLDYQLSLLADFQIEIPQFGSVRSLNAAASAAVIFSHWINYYLYSRNI